MIETAVGYRFVQSKTLSIAGEEVTSNIKPVSADNSPTTITETGASRRRRIWNSLRSWRRQRSCSRDREKALKRGYNVDDVYVTSTSEPELAVLQYNTQSDNTFVQRCIG